MMIAASGTVQAVIDLAAGCFEFGGFLAHADGEGFFGFDVLCFGVFANVLCDLHRAELWTAH